MAIAQVAQFGPTSGSGPTLALTGITCAAGNVLAIDVLAVNTGNTPISVSGVSDNVAGSLKNSYHIPARANQGAFFSGQNQFAAVATILCQVVTAISSGDTITVTFSTSAGFSEAESGTYSGLTGGLAVVAADLQSFLSTVSSAATPAVAAGPGSLLIAVCNLNGAANAVSNGYALRGDNMSAWLGTTGAGPTSTTFTLTASDPVWATTLVAFGPGAPVAAPRRIASLRMPGMLPRRRIRQLPVVPAAPGTPPPIALGEVAQRRQSWPRSVPRHSRVTLVVPPQLNPPYPVAETAQRRQAWARALPRRARITVVVRAQVNPPYPFAGIRQQRQPRGFFPRRGHGFTPVPAQQAATPAPAFTGQPLRHARLAAAPRRRLLVPPVPAQDTPAQRPRRARTVLVPARRGRTAAVTQGQHEPPRQRTVRRQQQPVQRRRHLTLVPPVQAAAAPPPWVASHRSPLRALALIRRRLAQLMPWPQATAATVRNATSAPTVTAASSSSPSVSGPADGALVTAKATSSPAVSDG